VARQQRLQREAMGGGGAAARRVGASAKQEVDWGQPTAAGGAGQRRRREEQRICPEVEENRLFCNFQNFQGLNCKLAITFKLKLK